MYSNLVFNDCPESKNVGFVCLLLLAFTNPLAGQTNACRYSKIYGYFAADCSNLNLFEIPSLQSDIDALDLSSNGIRKLKNDTFKCCTSIKFLYLQVNSILTIEENALQPLSDLDVLDLSFNSFDKFPLNVSPLLRRLYLDASPKLFQLPDNELKISHLKNVEFLSIAGNNLTKFPSFGGSIPNLIELNITDNTIERITPEDLAPLCQLKFLHVKPDSLFQPKDKLCECMKLENWTTTFGIKVDSFTCKHDGSIQLDKCDLRPSNVTLAKREACLTELKNRQMRDIKLPKLFINTYQ